MNAIEIRSLRKEYPGFLLDDISFDLPSGSIVGLVGENGAGKSTTIKLIMNAIRKDGGSVKVLGTDNESPDFSQLKNDIGVVLDDAYFPETLSAVNVGKVMANTYRNWDAAEYRRLLDWFSLPDKKAFVEYSRGMKMKLAIAVALSHRPRLLILDEATSGLDPMVRDEVIDVFNDFTREEDHSILLSSHIVSDLEKICDYVAFIHKGRLLLMEEKDRLLDQYMVARMPEEQLADLPEEAVVGVKKGNYGAEALVRRELVSPAFPLERTTLEEIILFLAKGGR